MKFSVRRLLALMGLLTAIGIVSSVDAKTIDVSPLDAGAFAQGGQYLADGAVGVPSDSYAGPAQSRSYVPSTLTDLYRRGRRLALEELRVSDSASLRTNQLALDLVK